MILEALAIATLLIQAPYSQRPAQESARINDSIDEQFSTVASAIELPSLDRVTLPAGARELRITENPPMAIGLNWPGVPLLRIVDVGNGRGFGELLRYRYVAGNQAVQAGERCATQSGRRVCVKTDPLSTSVDWPAVIGEFEKLGAWSLSQACHTVEDGLLTTELDILRMQRLDGNKFSAYTCYAPDRRQSPAGKQANAIYALFTKVVRQISTLQK